MNIQNPELEEILKNKPITPECPNGKIAGPCLIWTKGTGWIIKRIKRN